MPNGLPPTPVPLAPQDRRRRDQEFIGATKSVRREQKEEAAVEGVSRWCAAAYDAALCTAAGEKLAVVEAGRSSRSIFSSNQPCNAAFLQRKGTKPTQLAARQRQSGWIEKA